MSLQQPVVMIVDDEPQNLTVLEGMLRLERYKIVAFPRGELALEAAKAIDVDVILLDVRMPGLDGYEVCRRLKQMARLKEVPIVFLSALADPDDKVRAFEAGGVDYVTKPLSAPEVLARVRTHLTIRWHTAHLHDLVQAKAADLAAAHQRLQILDAAKTHWIATLAHELRTPLTGILCVADMLFGRQVPDSELSELRDGFEWASKRIRKLIEDATLLAEIDVHGNSFDIQKIDLKETVAAAHDEAATKEKDPVFEPVICANRVVGIRAAPGLLRQALSGLYHTAACCVHTEGRITTRVLTKGVNAVVEIGVQGRTLSPEDLGSFFEIGGQQTLFKGGADFGLSPVLSSKIIQFFGGDVYVRNSGQCGFVIEVVMPTHDES